MQYLILLVALPLLAAADHGPPGYGYAPKLYCRETNTSVYAEVRPFYARIGESHIGCVNPATFSGTR